MQCISLYFITPYIDIVTEDALVTRNFDYFCERVILFDFLFLQ